MKKATKRGDANKPAPKPSAKILNEVQTEESAQPNRTGPGGGAAGYEYRKTCASGRAVSRRDNTELAGGERREETLKTPKPSRDETADEEDANLAVSQQREVLDVPI